MALLVAGVIYIGFLFFSRFTDKQSRALDAIPEDAAVIFEIRDLPAVWNKLTKTNLMWPDLKSKEPFAQLNEIGKRIEKGATKNSEIISVLTQNPLVISLHQAAGGINFFIALSKTESEENALNLLKSLCDGEPSKAREFEGISIYHFDAGKFNLNAAFHSGVLMISDSESLIEAGLGRLIQGKVFDENPVFKKLNHTVSKTVDANIYIQHRYLPGILQAIGSKKLLAQLQSISPYAEMSELDLVIGPNSLSFSGFSALSDKNNEMISILKNQQPQPFHITRYVPEKISQMVFLGLSDIEVYFNDREAWLKSKNQLENFREELNSFNRDYDCNLKEHILSWMGNELVLFNVSYDSTDSDNSFLIIKKNETGNATKELQKLSLKLDTASKPVILAQGVEIRQLKAKGIFSILLGDLFNKIDNPYFIEVEDHVIFSESPSALQRYLSDLVSDNVLARNVTFVNYVNENLSDKANLFYYSNIGKMKEILQPAISEKWLTQLEKNKDLFGRFDAFSWQLSKSEGMFYNHIYMRYNPSFKEEENTFWEFALDTNVTMTPQLVLNHQTGAKDIFVQDDDFTCYLISNTGKLLWKKEMIERIVGSVKQVDMLNNGKLQIVFCTESQLHIIDLKGNYFAGYPVNIPKPVTAQFAIFDYESDKNYRFFIPSDKNMMVIDKDGKIVSGWEFPGANSTIMQPAEFHRINGKDYIFIIDIRGRIYMLDRKGKVRFEVKKALKDRSGSDVWFEAGKEIENSHITYSDSLGKIHRLYFNGREDSLTVRNLSPNHFFSMVDVNADGKRDILLQEDSKITIHSWNKELLFEHIFANKLTSPLMVFALKDRSIRLGVLDKPSNQVYVINSDGMLNDKFPVTGSTLFMMDDINNDSYPEIVVGNPYGKIFSYTVK